MNVILLEDVGRLGKLGDVVSVRSGYARNYLFPQRKAERANNDAIKRFEAQRAELEKHQKALVATTEKMRGALDGYLLQLVTRASPDGKLYGSITAQHIATALNEQKIVDGLVIKRGQVVLPDGAIKLVGNHTVIVRLYGDSEAHITVAVLSDDADSKTAAQSTAGNNGSSTKKDKKDHVE